MAGIADLNPVLLALIATCGTWFVTALGAALVVFTRRMNQKMLDGALGMAAGVMIAASFWSLLEPAIRMSESLGALRWVPALVGFLLGAGALWGIDKILPHLHPDLAKAEGPSTSWRRSTLLVLAITIHNFPEGTAVALPLRREGMSRLRALWYGQLSAVVEPIGGVLGAGMVMLMQPVLPYALAFAAGAMIFVVAEELLPEAQRNGNVDLATMGCMLGFAVMMTLDVALG